MIQFADNYYGSVLFNRDTSINFKSLITALMQTPSYIKSQN